MMMPKIDGITLIRELRKRDIYTPVIIVTAYESKVTSKILPSNRIKAVLAKPFDIQRLLSAVEESVVPSDEEPAITPEE
jgi:CheY-like chemotaxis protein